MTALAETSWPAARVGEALWSLCRRAGVVQASRLQAWNWPARCLPHPDAPRPEFPPGAHLADWLERAAQSLGADAEAIEAAYGELEGILPRAGAALLRLAGNGEARFLATVGGRGRCVWVLAPDGSVARHPVAEVRSALCATAEAAAGATVERVVEQAGLRGSRRGRARAGLLRELLGPTRVEAGWRIRPSPGAGLLTLAREARVPRGLLFLLGAHVAYCALWILSWWLLGSMAVGGRSDPGRLMAWGALLLALIPLRVLATRAAGGVAVRGSAQVKRRLLFGALNLDPDRVRHMGVGQFLGRVVESEVLDSMALTGGAFVVTALVELVLAGVVLGYGASGAVHVLLLLAAFGAIGVLGLRHFRRLHAWADQRFEMTNDLVERMVGHRTRLAQEPRRGWHTEEDAMLEGYLGLSAGLDRTIQWLDVAAPRGWLILGLLGLGPALVLGGPSPAALAVSLGGILIAYGAWRSLVEGIERLAAAAVAWERTKLFWHAARRTEPAAAPPAEPPARGRPLLEARDLVFRHPGRDRAVLDRVTLAVRSGEQLLLEGRSGGGKSTLGALLAGLRTPESGQLLLDGLDRQRVGEARWRRRIALAPQFHDNHVLLGSFAFNLLMGRGWPPRPADLAEAERICRSLGLGPLIERMPAGLGQMVGETGWQLSHGERSRLYLARALLQGADLLILDESFAALDPETLQASLGFLLKAAPTVVLIAHP